MFEVVKVRTKAGRCILVQQVHDIQIRDGRATLLWEMGILVLVVPAMNLVCLTAARDFESKPVYVISIEPTTTRHPGRLSDNVLEA